MEIKNETFWSMTKYTCWSGTFSLMSVVIFFLLVDAINPDIELFLSFFENDNMSIWFKFNVLDPIALLLNVAKLIFGLCLATIGMLTAILGKFFYDKAVDTLKSGA
jgi:hypothetical protein